MIRVFLIVFLMPLLSLVTQATAQVNWLTWEEAQERNKKEPRKIFVDVYTQWCGWFKPGNHQVPQQALLCYQV